MLESAGLDPADPARDLDDWIDDLQTLQDAGVEHPLALGTDWTQLQLFENVLIADLGPDAYSGLWNGRPAWNVPA